MNTDNPKSTNIPNNSSSKGSDTNIPSYNSDGGRSLAAIYYDKRGNVTTLKEVTDFGTLQTTTITQPGSMDYPGGSSGNVFSYNSWGALEKDTGRGITSVTYDNLGNPQQISYSDQSYTRHVYSSSGDKLKSVHHSTPSLLSLAAMDGTATKAVSAAAGQETFEYRGPVIYRNGAVHMVLFPGGYATISGSTVMFHYYTQDYLGNNRAVVNGSTGAIEQTTAYYPYGGVIADLGSGNSGQPFKFGGKELVTANGLNEYDFGARRYYQAIPHFTSIDPLCEKYYWLSPYLYCANNPVNLVDTDGKEVTLWATKLPGLHVPFATHTFLSVTNKDGHVYHFAYGSEFDGIAGATRGRLKLIHYEQDLNIIAGRDMESVKAIIPIPPPTGMTQEQFDEKVINIANDFGDNSGISYHFKPKEETQGNCNTSTYTILHKAGVSEEILNKLKKSIPGISWGFGDLKPWNNVEQKKAVEKSISSVIDNFEKWVSDQLDYLNSL